MLTLSSACCVCILTPLHTSLTPISGPHTTGLHLPIISRLWAIASINSSPPHLFCICSDHCFLALLRSCCCSWLAHFRPVPSNTRTIVSKPSMKPHDLAHPQMPVSLPLEVGPSLPKQMVKDWKTQVHPDSCRSKVLNPGTWHCGTKFTNVI